MVFTIRVADPDVVWLRSVLEAYEGLAQLYGDGTGQLLVITPAGRVDEVDSLLDEIRREIPLERLPFTQNSPEPSHFPELPVALPA